MLVYKITNRISGKSYIGVTVCDLAKRWREHRCAAYTYALRNPIYEDMRLYGYDAFTIEVLYEASSIREMLAVECGLIAAHGTYWPNGYNRSSGGRGGNPVDPARGKRSGVALLTEEIVRMIRDPARLDFTNDELVLIIRDEYAVTVSRDTVRDARRGDHWRHLNSECPPIRTGQGNRRSADGRKSSGRTLAVIRQLAWKGNAERLRKSKYRAKLTPEQVRAIFVDERPNREIERHYGMSHGVVGQIKARKTWADVTADLTR